ncbi:cytochrome P450-like protein 19 [Sarcoptes scabiei]|uniref:Cytochrome P450-like protein 19 n=1 Tax=Sarcoptes scabiei TaxID=52283 RepID=A0A132ADU0_SARSC|nr:cytochrome P450-like protein 19 [Sarcoptes scabiei]
MPFQDLTLSLARHGKIFGVVNYTDNLLVINDPKIVYELSIKEMNKFPVRFHRYFGTSSLSESVFMIPATDKWKRLRSIVTPAFTSALTMDVISACAYGLKIDSINEPKHPIVNHAKRILSIDVTFSQVFCYVFPQLAKFLGFEAFDINSSKYFDQVTFSIIEKRLKQNPKQYRDLIGLIMEQECLNENDVNPSKGISKREIAGLGIIFFLAGHDTTNTTLCHIFHYLIRYPEWQDKIYAELSKQDKLTDFDLLKSLPILNAVINETLRLNPPLILVGRGNYDEQKLLDTGIVVPKNCSISFHVNVIQRDPDYFDDPDSFKPQRFIDDPKLESSIAFMPFGVGPRLCVGMRFALNELRITLANFVKNYRLDPDPKHKVG